MNSKHIFPDSTRCGDAEAGDNNQIQVALVFYTFLAREITLGGKLLLVWVFVSKWLEFSIFLWVYRLLDTD